jgi:MFS family permease
VAIFVAAGVAGRLTSRLPRRLLIAPGFLLIGADLLLMRGLTPSPHWSHLLAGMIVCGIGGGLVSTPLISTASGWSSRPGPEWRRGSTRLCARWV